MIRRRVDGAAGFEPGVVVPYTPAPAVTLRVLTTYSSPSPEWQWTGAATGRSTFVIVLNEDSLFVRTMFTDASSLDAAFQTAAYGTTFVVVSPRPGTDGLLEQLRQLVLQRIEYMGLDPNYWAGHFLFAPAQQAYSDSWLVPTLRALPSALTDLVVQLSNGTAVRRPRVDGYWPFVLQPPAGQFPLLTTDASACAPLALNANNSVVLLRHDPACSFARQILAVQRAGGVAAVLYPAASDQQPVSVRCTGVDCDLPVAIAASMIAWRSAADVLAALAGQPQASAALPDEPTSGFFAEIDGQGLLRSPGDVVDPTFEAFVWEAQYLQYQTELNRNLSLIGSRQLRVAVAEHALNPATVQVLLPPPATARRYRAYVDFRLECQTAYDASCPDWDRILSMTVGCSADAYPTNTSDFVELQRWISSFHRTGGRWLTDVTALLPLLDGPYCTFHLTSGTSENWYYSADIVWDTGAPLLPAPSATKFLWSGGSFNAQYNDIHPPVYFVPPPGSRRVQLVAIISGHGCDSPNCCGEFCPTEHVFTVNNATTVATSSDGYAGTQWGCANMGLHGAAPNQYGTFFYGRDFWCDAMYVPTWVWDITDAVSFSQTNVITYVGLFKGATPDTPPSDNQAIIDLSSYLTFY